MVLIVQTPSATFIVVANLEPRNGKAGMNRRASLRLASSLRRKRQRTAALANVSEFARRAGVWQPSAASECPNVEPYLGQNVRILLLLCQRFVLEGGLRGRESGDG